MVFPSSGRLSGDGRLDDYVRTKIERRMCAAESGQVMMTTACRLTYETHTSIVGSYRCQTTCLSDHSTGTPYSTYYYALTCLTRVVVEQDSALLLAPED